MTSRLAVRRTSCPASPAARSAGMAPDGVQPIGITGGNRRAFNPLVRGSSPRRPTKQNQAVASEGESERDLRVTLRREAIAFLRGAHTEAGGDLATALAHAVLGGAAELPGEWTRLALDVRDADPSWAAKTVTLAGLVLDDALGEPDQQKVGGGQR